MSKTINFVAERRKKLSRSQQQDIKHFRLTSIITGAIFLVFLATVGVRLFFVYQVKQVADAQKNTRNIILSQEHVERDYNIFAYKLRSLSELFGKRRDKQEAFIFFSQVFGPEVIVSGIDYTASEQDILSFTIQAPNIFVLEKVFDTLQSDIVRDPYPKVARSDLRRTPLGFYTLKLTVTVGT